MVAILDGGQAVWHDFERGLLEDHHSKDLFNLA